MRIFKIWFDFLVTIQQNPSESKLTQEEAEIIPTRWGNFTGCDCYNGRRYELKFDCWTNRRPPTPVLEAPCAEPLLVEVDCEPFGCSKAQKFSFLFNFSKMIKIAGKINGGWTEWSEWSGCPKNCGCTIPEYRLRFCANPFPANDGKPCFGSSKEFRDCSNEICTGEPRDGGFTEWTEWSSCSKTCGPGQQTRRRSCTNPRPLNGGKNCGDDMLERRSCTNPTPCPSKQKGKSEINYFCA